VPEITKTKEGLKPYIKQIVKKTIIQKRKKEKKRKGENK
jgi:hypothetical protein